MYYGLEAKALMTQHAIEKLGLENKFFSNYRFS